MMSIESLMQSSLLGVFNQRDEPARLEAMRELYAPGIRFSDDEGTVTGINAVNAKIRILQERTPGFVFSAAGPVHEVQDLGSLAWSYGPEGADPVVSGTDVVLVSDSLIVSLYTYLTGR